MVCIYCFVCIIVMDVDVIVSVVFYFKIDICYVKVVKFKIFKIMCNNFVINSFEFFKL